jgi:hypothetical protein
MSISKNRKIERGAPVTGLKSGSTHNAVRRGDDHHDDHARLPQETPSFMSAFDVVIAASTACAFRGAPSGMRGRHSVTLGAQQTRGPSTACCTFRWRRPRSSTASTASSPMGRAGGSEHPLQVHVHFTIVGAA